MKCEHCGFEGRGSRGIWMSNKKGEHWRCPVCRELTKLPPKQSKPRIKGYCIDCKYLEDNELGRYCNLSMNDMIPDKDYCSKFEKKE